MRWIRSIMMAMVNSMFTNSGCKYIWMERAFHWQIVKPKSLASVHVCGGHCGWYWMGDWSQNWLVNSDWLSCDDWLGNSHSLSCNMWLSGGCGDMGSISSNSVANQIYPVRNMDIVSCSCMSNEPPSLLEVKALYLAFEGLSPSSFLRMISNNVHNVINHGSFITINEDQILVFGI